MRMLHTMLRVGNLDRSLAFYCDVLAMRHLAFRVNATGFAQAKDELTRRGIAFEFQDHDIAHSIYFDDPDGHRLEITTYEL